MGLNYSLNSFKEIAKMSLELLGLLLELLLLLLHVFNHVLLRGHEAPPCNHVTNKCVQQKQQQLQQQLQQQPQQLQGHFGNFFQNVWPIYHPSQN